MWLRLKGLFLPIFAIILCIYPLYTSAQGTIFSYTEKNNNGRALRVYKAKKFDDGTVIVRIIKDDANSPSCYYDTLSFRIIHPDGTVDERDIGLNTLGLEQFNYCRPEGDIDYQIIRKDQILVTFYRPSGGITFEQWGVIIGFDGKEISRASLGNTVGPISKVTLNSNKEHGFLKLASMRNTDGTNSTTWVQYKIEKDGAFTKLTEGGFNFDYFLNPTSTVISTVGEGYAVIYATMKANGYVASNPLLSQGILYALTIGYNQTTVSPLLLYQTPLPNLSFRALSCDISYSGVGQVCTLTVSLVGATGAPTRNFYVKVNFLSSGSVTSSKVITRTIPNDVPSIIWRVDVLPFGGFMFSNFVRGAQDSTITGFLFGEEDPTAYNWGLPVPEPINSDGVYLILPNNTLLVFQKETFNSWRFEKVDLLRFDVKKIENGYSNINILSTIPGIGDSIYENATETVSITFYNPVELSDGNLLIIQEDNNSLRQIIPGTKCSLDGNSNDTMVIVNVLISTFSIPKGNYFIMMESNFVKDKAYKEPLLGIREHVWHFATESEKVAQTPSRSGLFRLTVEGTKYYDSLKDREGRRNFFSSLKNQIAVAVPIDASRLVTIEKVQVDRSVNDKQYLLAIGVKDTNKDDEINVSTVIDYIHTMVTHKDQTQIGLGDTTNYLDETYGFNRLLNIWERYYRVLSVLFVLVILLFASFLSAQIKTKNNENKKDIKNVAILQLGLIIFDLVMDILFVSSSSKDFQELYIPSVVFLTLPIAINTILAFYIITQENSSNQKFYQWFIKNGKIASVFTVLAGADIEALNILHSNLLGVELFRAPFSKKAKDIITRGGYLNIFTEDIPQVIIQIVYYKKAVNYGLIPLLTFISSVLTLAINLSSILYEKIQQNQKTDLSNNANDENIIPQQPPPPIDSK